MRKLPADAAAQTAAPTTLGGCTELPEVPDVKVSAKQDAPHDLWKRLGVAQEATEGEIQKAFRRLAALLHPDKHPGDEEAKRRFQLVSEAHDVLCDKEQRSEYVVDVRRALGLSAQPKADPFAAHGGRDGGRPAGGAPAAKVAKDGATKAHPYAHSDLARSHFAAAKKGGAYADATAALAATMSKIAAEKPKKTEDPFAASLGGGKGKGKKGKSGKIRPTNWKDSICKFWAEGYCWDGDECGWAHGEHELVRSVGVKAEYPIGPTVGPEMGPAMPLTTIRGMKEGDEVEAHSLKGAAHLNGLIGTITGRDEDRWAVRFPAPHGKKSLKAGNLTKVVAGDPFRRGMAVAATAAAAAAGQVELTIRRRSLDDAMGVNLTEGLVVQGVERGTPASLAGLSDFIGWRLTQIGASLVHTLSDCGKYVNSLEIPMTLVPPETKESKVGHAGIVGPVSGVDPVTGNWTCRSCGNVNLAFRRHCNRHSCAAPKPRDPRMEALLRQSGHAALGDGVPSADEIITMSFEQASAVLTELPELALKVPAWRAMWGGALSKTMKKTVEEMRNRIAPRPPVSVRPRY